MYIPSYSILYRLLDLPWHPILKERCVGLILLNMILFAIFTFSLPWQEDFSQ